MKPLLFLLIGSLAMSLAACHKQATPAQAIMDAETRQKAVEVRAAADRAVIAQQAAAAKVLEVKKVAKEPVPTK